MANRRSKHTTNKDRSIKMTATYYTLILPVTETLFFIGAVHFLLERKEWQAMILFLFAALFLSFSVHICLHEFLHHYFKRNTPWFLSYSFTLLSGMPFDGFRLHHINHHQHNNSPLDFSTTRNTGNNSTKPQNMLLYAIKWPLQLFKVMKFARSQAKQGLLSQETQSSIRKQQLFLAVFFCTAIITSPKIFLLYAALIYVGWTIVSIHNYGQHSCEPSQKNHEPSQKNHEPSQKNHEPSQKNYEPSQHAVNSAISTYNRWYNIFLFNNGLHFEHHDQPEKSWRELSPSQKITAIKQKQSRKKEDYS